MTNFCRQCGTPAVDGASFCDECGSPMSPSPAGMMSAVPSVAAAPMAINKRVLAIGGGVVVLLAVIGGGIALMLAPEKASEASFSRAITSYLARNSAIQDSLLCLTNLPYQRDQLQLNEYDQQNRQWMDALARSGLYTGPEEQNSGGFFSQTLYAYRITPAGKSALRNNKLCLASGLTVKTVSGFDRVLEINGRPSARAQAVLEVSGEADWLSTSPDRSLLLKKLRIGDSPSMFPMVQIEKKWTVNDNSTRADDTAFARSLAAPTGRDTSAAASPADFFSKLRSLFSFGAAHPLVGKWSGFGGSVIEFTADTVITNGVAMKATFATNGNQVTVTPEVTNGVGMVYKIVDNNTASMDMGFMEIQLTRVK